MRVLKGVVFDFDGVIADSMGLQESAWREAWDQVLSSPDESTWQGLRHNFLAGRSGDQIFEGLALPEADRERLRGAKDALWRNRRARVLPVHGAVAGLRKLADLFPLAIATSSCRGYVEAFLAREGLTDRFRAVVTDGEVSRPKPAPDPLLEVGRILGLALESLLMVGDTAIDSELARAAGCPFLLFRQPGSHRAELELKDLDGVESWPELVERVLQLDS